MKSEEPYLYELAFIGANGEGWRVVGPDGPQGNILGSENVAIETVRFLNIAYANGRNAAEKVTTEGATHWTPITNVELEILIKDFDELLHLANVMSEMLKENSHSPSFEMRFIEWKKARGIE